MKFYERIKELRKDKKLSQMELAKSTGLNQSAIARWELNKTEPTASAIIILCKYFNVTADYLLGLTDY